MTNGISPQPSSSPAPRGQVISWAFFDFANTAFYVLILTVGFPLYFKEIIAEGSAQGDFLWGTSFSISMLIVAFLSPILGAIADSGAGKKIFLGVFTGICVCATSLMFFLQAGYILIGMILLVLANIGFEGGLVFYDAFLPEISTERSYGRVSGYGYALGYTGSLVTLAVAFPLYVHGFSPDNLLNVRFSFLIAATFFLAFSLPLFRFLPDKQRTTVLTSLVIKAGFRRLRSTYKQFSQYKNIARFLLAYFIYIDGVNTIIVFSSIFARQTLQMDLGEIIIFFALVQTSAIVGSLLFGVCADHFGHKKTLSGTLLLWIGIVSFAYFIQDVWMFYFLGVLAGIAMGSSQSISRSLMSEITPKEKKTEFFGFYSFFGKASAILGPFVFGIVSVSFGQRIAILSIGIFLVTGLLLLQRVEDRRSPWTPA